MVFVRGNFINILFDIQLREFSFKLVEEVLVLSAGTCSQRFSKVIILCCGKKIKRLGTGPVCLCIVTQTS